MILLIGDYDSAPWTAYVIFLSVSLNITVDALSFQNKFLQDRQFLFVQILLEVLMEYPKNYSKFVAGRKI